MDISRKISIERETFPPGTSCECGDCGSETQISDLLDLQDTGAVLTPGDPVPAGRCPSCDALAYLANSQIESIESTLPNYLAVAAERFQQNAKDLREGVNGMETLDAEARERLARQFDAQYKEATALAQAIRADGLWRLVAPGWAVPVSLVI